MENINIIKDLAIVLTGAGIAGIVFHCLKLPLLLGYILVGLLIGPHLLPFDVVDEQLIGGLSSFGIIFLMFYIGLEFDLRKLQQTIGPVIGALLLQTIAMFSIGTLIASSCGWGGLNSFFLGGSLSISSTMVSVASLREQHSLNKSFAQFTLGILILEDIVAILLLVIMTGISVTGKFKWGEVWEVSFFVGVFVTMVFFIGRLLSPRLVKLLERIGLQEILVVVIIGVILAIGSLANHFSFALGAFLAGTLLSQSSIVDQIESVTEPLRNIFTATFFVSIGLMIQPLLILDHIWLICILTLLVIIGKTLACWLGLYLCGQKSRSSFKSSLIKAQIGEFSFVIVALGQRLQVTDPDLMAVATGTALGTIAITPLISKKSDALFDFLSILSPNHLTKLGESYQNALKRSTGYFLENPVFRLMMVPVLQILGYFFIISGILWSAAFLSNWLWYKQVYIKNLYVVQSIIWGLTISLLLPFIAGVMRKFNVVIMAIIDLAIVSKDRAITKGRFYSLLYASLIIAGLLISCVLLLSTAAHDLPGGSLLMFFGISIVLLSVFFWKKLIRLNSYVESLFSESFKKQSQSIGDERRKAVLDKALGRSPWNFKIQTVVVPKESEIVGKRISEINLRKETGVTIIALSRNRFVCYDPNPHFPIFPKDHLILLGEEDQLSLAKGILTKHSESGEVVDDSLNFDLAQIEVKPNYPLINESLESANIQALYGVNIVAIQRGQTRIMSPKAQELIKIHDLLLVIGKKDKIQKFKSL